MPAIRVVVTDYVEADLDWETRQMQEIGCDFEVHQLRDCPEEVLAAATREADVVVACHARITAALVAGWRRCALVIRHGTGFDNVDVPALTARGIRFANVADYCSREVAEHAVALIFALGRKLAVSRRVLDRWCRERLWDFQPLEPLHRLEGQSAGIIGCGRIGSRVLRALQGLGFRCLVCDPYLSQARLCELGVETVKHEEVYREADFITLHVPLTEETRHMIDARALALMKPSACLINTSRGGVVDQRALAAALGSKRLAGAGLDVFEDEPPAQDDPLLWMENAVLTAHSAWFSAEAGWDMRRRIVEQIRRFRDGLPPLDWVNEKELCGSHT